MLTWAAGLLSAGTLLGLVLVVLSQSYPAAVRIPWPGAVHGLMGLAGFVALVLGLVYGPPRGVQQGAGSFGVVAAGFVAAGLALGGLIVIARLRREPPAFMLLGIHATLGVAGLVMLAAYLSV